MGAGVLGSWKDEGCRLGKTTPLGSLGWEGWAGLWSHALGQASLLNLSPTL